MEGDAPAPAPSPGETHDPASRARALDRVRGPAIGLLVVGILGIVLSSASILLNLLGIGLASRFGEGQQMPGAEWIQMLSGAVGVVVNMLDIGICAFLIFAALRMKDARSHSIAMVASILSIVPCVSCCCLGMPIGIWSLVVLWKPEVKAGFEG